MKKSLCYLNGRKGNNFFDFFEVMLSFLFLLTIELAQEKWQQDKAREIDITDKFANCNLLNKFLIVITINYILPLYLKQTIE